LLPGTLSLGVFHVTSARPGARSSIRINEGDNGCADAVGTQHAIMMSAQATIAGAEGNSLEKTPIGSSMDMALMYTG
jgi:hypothetical protein